MDLTLEVIETERLLLVPADLKFANEIFKNFNSETTKYMYPKPANDISETIDFLRNSILEMKKQGALPAQDPVAQWHHACGMGSGGFHRQAGGAGPATARPPDPLPRGVCPERRPARTVDAIGARQAA